MIEWADTGKDAWGVVFIVNDGGILSVVFILGVFYSWCGGDFINMIY